MAVEAEKKAKRKSEEIPDHEIYLAGEKGPWSAKTLSLEGTLELISFLGGVIDDVRPFLEGGEGMKFGPLLGALGKDNLLALLSLITQQTPEWIEKNFDLPKAINAIMDFWEENRLGDILGLLGWGGLVERGRRGQAQEEETQETEE